ncbi:MAG: DUF362 domain-containing protein [Candidatus Omnitrophota bacterium]
MENPSKSKSKVFFKRIQEGADDEAISRSISVVWGNIFTSTFAIKPETTIAIKLSFNEKDIQKSINPAWISSLVSELKQRAESLFIIENNLLDGEIKSNAIKQLKVLYQNNYTMQNLDVPIIIGDGIGGSNSQIIQIKGDHLDSTKISQGVCESDLLISINFLSKYANIGLGGSIKGLGSDCASLAGKLIQRSNNLPEVIIERCTSCSACIKVCPANAIGLKNKKAILVKERCIACGECTIACKYNAIITKQEENPIKHQEKMVEYAMGVKKALKSKIASFNILPEKKGVVGGSDPVSVDKASLDIIGPDAVKSMFGDIDTETQIRHGEKIKLGSAQYELLEI